MGEWTIAQRVEAFSTGRWSVERSLRTRAGDPVGRAHEFHTVRIVDFVNVIPVTSAGELVLVRQFRHGAERDTLEFPGGLLDPGEDPTAAALREMREETGYELPRGALFADLGVILPNPAMLNNRNYFFVADGVEPTGALDLEETEDVELVIVPEVSIGALIDSGEFNNAMMLAGLTLYERWRRRQG